MLAEGLGDWEDWGIAAILILLAQLSAFLLAKLMMRRDRKKRRAEQEVKKVVDRAIDEAFLRMTAKDICNKLSTDKCQFRVVEVNAVKNVIRLSITRPLEHIKVDFVVYSTGKEFDSN